MPVHEQDRERFNSLMREYDEIDKSQHPQKAASLLEEAGSFVDREAEPEKWAAFRSACTHSTPKTWLLSVRSRHTGMRSRSGTA
ncbi:MAG: hypothetical protein JW989_04155 [Chlorobiaceae bacterium]|nr:hypothetical protein [Chlorobiaceae bacterium]